MTQYKNQTVTQRVLRFVICGAAALVVATGDLSATEPCGNFDACKALIEINATDGDIGFHFSADGDNILRLRLRRRSGRLFAAETLDQLETQRLSEISVESAEPSCVSGLTLENFLGRWTAERYNFTARSTDDEGVLEGVSPLTHELPAAPKEVDFDALTGVISWEPGDDLGLCGTNAELGALVTAGILPVHPEDVEVDAWEIVLEPDVEAGDPLGELVFSIRVAGDINPLAVTVPADYLASLPDDTPVKIEIGAIGGEHNATFTEADGFCVNEVNGCE